MLHPIVISPDFLVKAKDDDEILNNLSSFIKLYKALCPGPITFVLKQANIDTASDVTTSSGTGVSILDNLADLNGRKYITHRIERADGYSLQFVIE